MPLLLNMLSRLVITFLPRSKHLLILWLQSPSAVILEPPKIKSVTVSIVSPSICPEVMGPDAMIFVFECGVVSQLFHSSFTFIKRLFSSSLLSAIKLVSSAYLRLLIFLPAVLIPACASSSPAFRMMYSACKLSKQGLMYSFPDFQLLARRNSSVGQTQVVFWRRVRKRDFFSCIWWLGDRFRDCITPALPRKQQKRLLIPAHCVLLLQPTELQSLLLILPSALLVLMHCCLESRKW